MKKNLIWIVSLLLAVAVTFGASQLSAKNKEKEPASPRTRIGLINLTYVIKNYKKFQQFQVEMKEIMEPYQKRDAELRAQWKKLSKQTEKPSVIPAADDNRDEDEKKEELEDQAKKIERQIEENNDKIKKKLHKKSDDEMRMIFMDIYDAAQRYAGSHDLDLVLHYNDAVTKDDFLSAQNIARKLNTAALMPLYCPPSMDISRDLVGILNRKAREN